MRTFLTAQACLQDASTATRFEPHLGVWVVSRKDEIRDVLCDARRFSAIALSAGQMPVRCPHDHGRLAFEEALMTSDPPFHTALRHSLSGALGKKRLADYEQLASHKLSNIIAELRPFGRADLIQDICTPLLSFIMTQLLGSGSVSVTTVARWMKIFSPGYDDAARANAFLDRDAAGDEIWHAVLTAQELTGPGLLHDLAEECQKGEIKPAQAIDICASLLRGSSDTVGYLTGNTLLALHATPDLIPSLYHDPDGIDDALKASLLSNSPLQITIRKTTQEVQLGDVAIPENELVLLLIGDANRQEQLNAPSACHHAGLAFGAGIHRCPGALLAHMLAKQIFKNLLEGAMLPDVDLTTLVWSHQIALRGPDRLEIIFRP